MRKTYFQYFVAAGKQCKIRPMVTTDGKQLLLCAENTRVPDLIRKAQALAAVPEETIIGPVSEVYIVKILDGYGIEVAIPSIAYPMDTSCVAKSRETERFVNELRDHKEELRSSK